MNETGYMFLSCWKITFRLFSLSYVAHLDVRFFITTCGTLVLFEDLPTRGVVLKNKWGTPKTRLRQSFFKKQFRPTYTYTHTCQKNCHSGSLLLSCDTATRVWVSVADRCTNLSPKKWGEWGTRPPSRKKWGTPSPRVPAPLHERNWLHVFILADVLVAYSKWEWTLCVALAPKNAKQLKQ